MKSWFIWGVLALTGLMIVAQFVAYYHYRDDVDSIFVNLSILGYYLLVIGAIAIIKVTVERSRRRRRLQDGRPQLRDLPKGR